MEVLQGRLSKSDHENITRLIYNVSRNFKIGTDGLQHLLSEYFGYHASIFWKVDQKGNLSDPINHVISDDLVDDYQAYFHNHDYLHPKNHLHLYPKEISLRLEDVIQLKDYETSDYYKEFMKKHEYYHQMVISFYSRNKFNGVLGIAKSKSQGPFSEKDRLIFKALAPVLSNILYLEREYDQQRKEKEMFEAFADKSNTGFILLDQNYHIIYTNQAVLRIFKEDSLYKNIESFIEDIFDPRKRLNSTSRLHLQGLNIRIISHQELFLSKESCFAVIIEEDKTNIPFYEDNFVQLTKREKEVCLYLKKGYTYQEISEKLFISVHTVNKHIKNIYQKMGVNSRASLQAKLLNPNAGKLSH